MSDLQTELEAQAFRKLLAYFKEHTEVQNIDLMIHAGFCRNCLAKWYASAAQERGVSISYEDAREVIYGMPYDQWKETFQLEATPDQLALLAKKIEK